MISHMTVIYITKYDRCVTSFIVWLYMSQSQITQLYNIEKVIEDSKVNNAI